MLEPEDIQEIYTAFFEDAGPLLAAGRAALQDDDRTLLGRKMHALKGAALNLRMDEAGHLAEQAEKNTGRSISELEEILELIQLELERLEAAVTGFYKSET